MGWEDVPLEEDDGLREPLLPERNQRTSPGLVLEPSPEVSIHARATAEPLGLRVPNVSCASVGVRFFLLLSHEPLRTFPQRLVDQRGRLLPVGAGGLSDAVAGPDSPGCL